MKKIYNAEVLEERARNLGARNGIKLLFVTLDPLPPATAVQAFLDLEFHNANVLATILNDVNVNGVPPTDIFVLSGGSRKPAGAEFGQVQVITAAAGAVNTLRLTVVPIGDYSTYTLRLRDPAQPLAPYPDIDPIFHEIEFKFRPGCFNLNCAPNFGSGNALATEPVIDYLAKDYDSFKHVLIGAMQERVPGWQPTSEADLDQVLIDLIAADADETSDFQDRVVSEGNLATARKRVSIARHARLMDYHIHQGNQATTWLALEVSTDVVLAPGFGAWTGKRWNDPGTCIFLSQETRSCFEWLNALALYNWDGLVPALERGATEADLRLPAPLDATVEADADQLRDLLRSDAVPHLLVQQWLNPETGTVNGRDVYARQLLKLLPGVAAAESVFDPAAGEWFVRVHWRATDALTRRYCFIVKCPNQPPSEEAALFHGNLIPAAHGRPHITVFRALGQPLATSSTSTFIATSETYFEQTNWGTLCTLPESPLSYRKTLPGGEHPTRSSLSVIVSTFANAWEEQSDLIESESDDEHYIVETDEYRTSRVRFGDNLNGRALAADAVVSCAYQVGQGEDGNVGADTLNGFDAVTHPEVSKVWNPFDVVDGREPELTDEILRRVPEAYRQRQLRAVTLEDYVKRAEELDVVSHAAARYAWTGSWRTVRVAIDPAGTTELSDAVRRKIEAHLNAVRLIGEDLEIRRAQYVPLDIKLKVCANIHYWPADLDAVLQQEFSDGYTADGRQGFFHPDRWTFGQPLYASQLIGRALAVPGVERVLSVSIKRFHALAGPSLITITLAPEDVPLALVDKLDVDAFEILQVANDPGELERGRIEFDIQGGRR
ncbi:MAG TPA: hypothetical protein VJS66_09680 [Burkholderiales bacterium]|nr:hypothetical protein [Burkholderiales bacterium]